MWGAVELGGTKVNVAVGTGPDDIRAEARIPTTTPDETLSRVLDFFQGQDAVQGLGLACFGPVDLKTGSITTTTKPGWSHTPIAAPLGAALGCSIAFDTDVNGAAWGERKWGAAQGLGDFVYVTIGTGIGGGAVVGGRLLHGMAHPEMGHIRLQRHPSDAAFNGICPFHGDCLEGLASGPALAARLGRPAQDVGADDAIWDIEADYLAQLCLNLTMIMSPRKIILGGGVMAQGVLLPKVRARFDELCAAYMSLPALDDYIVAPGLGQRAGLLGAMALIMDQQGNLS